VRVFAARPNSRLKGGTPDSPARQEEDAPLLEAARLRPEHRGGIVVWLAAQNCFRTCFLFATNPSLILASRSSTAAAIAPLL
jgi:hypothetical protein